jgi:CheY-like chemotaxis protein
MRYWLLRQLPSKILGLDIISPDDRRQPGESTIHRQDDPVSQQHQIGFAENATDAIESMVQRRPDVILLDLFIPEMDGFQLFENLRKQPATESIPVIGHSAIPLDPVTALRVKRMRSEGFIEFPIDFGTEGKTGDRPEAE